MGTKADRDAETGTGLSAGAAGGAGADGADITGGGDEADGLDGETADTPWVEVYNTRNEFAAQTVAAEVLESNDIPTIQHDRRSHSIPAPATMAGEIGIAVPESRARQARELLHEAMRNGLILDGEVIDADGDEGEVVV
jgi:hypothetical protein